MSGSDRDINQGQQRGGLKLRRSAPVWLAVLAFCGLLLAPEAWAQFTGPSPQPSPGLNLQRRPTTDPAILYPPSRELRLESGDLIVVHVYGTTAVYDPSARVSLDGSVQLPLVGVVQVSGLTLHEAETTIAERLQTAGMYRDPQVTIQLTESPNQNVTLAGEIHGVIPVLGGRRRLLDVISAAGGFAGNVSHTVTINRPGVEQPIVIDLGPDPTRSAQANVPVFPHDTILTSRTGVIYLLGAFKSQGAVPIQSTSPLTLLQAAAIGSGPGWEGKYDDLRIVRSVGLERQVVKVNMNKVMSGKAPDPVLQTDDIVFLPTSPMKSAIKNGGIGTLMGIISIMFVAVQTAR